LGRRLEAAAPVRLTALKFAGGRDRWHLAHPRVL